ncbi:MAG: AAA family ATPase [Pseudomonadota bacterium]
MYYQYFGLAEAPFSIAVNPRYLYMSPRHRDALAHLLYGVGAGGGFILLTGEVGTGKTTINRCLLEQLPDSADIAIVLNPALNAQDLLTTVCEELSIELSAAGKDNPDALETEVDARAGLKVPTDALHKFLLANHESGRKTVLMIDEAQHLSFDVLEQIRLLTNLETNEEKLLHIILIGQPELADKLARPELRQLNQRITARFELKPLSREETGAYIRHRLHVAGLVPGQELFPRKLVHAIHRHSRGIPRLINLLCDRLMLGAYGQGLQRLDTRLLTKAVGEVTGSNKSAAMSFRRYIPAAVATVAVLIALGLLVERFPSDKHAASPGTSSGLSPSTASQPELGTEERFASALQEAAALESVSVPTNRILESQVARGDEDRWRMSSPEAVNLLLRLYDLPVGPSVGDLCAAVTEVAWRCEQLALRSWNQLIDDGRPAILKLLGKDRIETSALFLGMEGDQLLLASDEGAEAVSAASVAEEWTAEIQRLWMSPTQVRRVLQRGDSGSDVAYVADLFARLDGQSEPLTTSRYDQRLEARVSIFQKEHGLNADGVLGQKTLRRLVLAAGADLGLAQARRNLKR